MRNPTPPEINMASHVIKVIGEGDDSATCCVIAADLPATTRKKICCLAMNSPYCQDCLLKRTAIALVDSLIVWVCVSTHLTTGGT